MTYRILFVCLGNICRSPAAENVMNDLIHRRGLTGQIVCDSAGTGGWHVGEPPDRRMREAARQHFGLTFVGSARRFEPEDLGEFDLILAMDRENYRDILQRDANGAYGDRVKMMCDFCRHHDAKEVPDPYYGGPEGFKNVIDLLVDACEGLLESLEADGVI